MAFSRVNPGGWSLYEVLTASQMNSLDINVSNAVDGAAGGSYSPSAKLTWNHQIEVDASSVAFDGIDVTGGSSDSAGIVAAGGVTNGHAVDATGAGTGAGIKADSSTGPSVYANKSLEFHGTLAYQNPAATTGLTNELRATLVPKIWGNVSTGGGGPIIEDGANIASVSYSGSNLVVTIADDMTNVYYAVVAMVLAAGSEFCTTPSMGTSNFQLKVYDDAGTQINLSTTGRTVMFIVLGEQTGDLS